MIKVNAINDSCPIPIIKTKNAIKELNGSGQIEVLVDNEIAVQNLLKMAKQKHYQCESVKMHENLYRVVFTIDDNKGIVDDYVVNCKINNIGDSLVVLASRYMGDGDKILGAILMKGFIYSLTQLEKLPKLILLYNEGAYLSCEDGDILNDLKTLEAQGVEILTCGTCLNHYQLTDKLKVGKITNMYNIVELLNNASKVIKP